MYYQAMTNLTTGLDKCILIAERCCSHHKPTHTHTHTHTYTHAHTRTRTHTHTPRCRISLVHPNIPFLSLSLSPCFCEDLSFSYFMLSPTQSPLMASVSRPFLAELPHSVCISSFPPHSCLLSICPSTQLKVDLRA